MRRGIRTESSLIDSEGTSLGEIENEDLGRLLGAQGHARLVGEGGAVAGHEVHRLGGGREGHAAPRDLDPGVAARSERVRDLYGLDSRIASALEGRRIEVSSRAEPVANVEPSSSEEAPRSRRRAGQQRQRQAPVRRNDNPFASIFQW